MASRDDRTSGRGPCSVPYPPSAVANFFLSKSEEITQMKLHKLLYYAQGWYLAVTGRPLLNETITAWKYGPVVPSLYYYLKKFGARPIDRLTGTIDRQTRVRYAAKIDPDDHVVRGLLERIWSVYGGLSGRQLSQLTHAPDTPWSRVREMHPELSGVDIPNEEIRRHFRQRLEQGESRG
jgi:uncharacterized phage-associated protein